MHGSVHGSMHGMVHGCMVVCILPGLVKLDLGVGGCLVGGDEEVFGVVSCAQLTHHQIPILTLPNRGALALHDTAARS